MKNRRDLVSHESSKDRGICLCAFGRYVVGS